MAEAKKKDPAKVQLKKVRLSFAQSLYKAKPFGGSDGDGEPNHSANFLIDPETREGKVNIEKMEDAIDHAIANHAWKDGKKPKFSEAKLPLRDGNNHDYDGYEDMMYVSASNKKKPRILDIDKLDVQEGDDGAPYSGCLVDAIVRVWAQDNKWGKRINASLEGVRFRDDGDAFGAAPLDPDEFDDDEDDRGSSRRSSSKRKHDEDDGDDRGSRRGSSRRSRDEGDGEDDRRSSRRSRDRDEDKGDRRSSRRSRDEDDAEDDRRSSRRGRGRDEDEGDDDRRSSRSRSRSRDDDEEKDERRSSRRGRDEDDKEERSHPRRGRDEDEGDDDRSERRSSRRRGRGDDDDLA